MANRRRRVNWTIDAQDALNEALEFIAQKSPDGSRRVLHAAMNLVDSLEALSERGRIVPEFSDPNVREVFVYSYRVLYRIEADGVTVIAFLHGARDFERWVRRKV